MINQVRQKSGGAIDAVLAVAGVDIAGTPTIAINYYDALATLQGLRPLLLKSTAPREVAVSSITSYTHMICHRSTRCWMEPRNRLSGGHMKTSYAYATSKRALSRWIRRDAVNAEWAGSGIPLNAVAPGLVKTEMLARLFEDPKEKARHHTQCQ
jgi:NAD(P)-dependent dehydrogenase (short-subunit alcohol dehydrogenase family)